MQKRPGFLKESRGAVAVMFALLLPILLLFTIGLIDFGQWFYLGHIVERTTANAANAIQRDQSQAFSQVNDGAGLGVANMAVNGNFICAQAATDEAGARAAAHGCGGNGWNIGNPTGNPTSPYYVGVSSHLAYTPVIPFSESWPPRNIFARTTVKITPNNLAVASRNLPNCAATGRMLSSNGSNFVCVDVAARSGTSGICGQGGNDAYSSWDTTSCRGDVGNGEGAASAGSDADANADAGGDAGGDANGGE